jgi:hypothetical protein
VQHCCKIGGGDNGGDGSDNHGDDCDGGGFDDNVITEMMIM